MRSHQTAYAKIVETGDNTNIFNCYIGKKGINGNPTYRVYLDEEKQVARTKYLLKPKQPTTTHIPRIYSGAKSEDRNTRTAKIAVTLLDRLLCKEARTQKKVKKAA